MRPLLFRPPDFFTGSSRLFSGVVFVTSSKVDTDMNRRPGLVGLNLRTGIRQGLKVGGLEDLDLLAGVEFHDGLLPAGARALDQAAPLRLRPHLDDVDRRHLDVEQLLDRLAHLRLVGVGVHAERVLAVFDLGVALLRDDGRDEDFLRVKTHAAARFGSSSSAASVRMSARAQTIVATSTSAGSTTSARWRFRNDLTTFSWSGIAITTTGRCLPHSS